MFYRRKIILSFLQAFDNELDKMHLLKLLFVFTQKQTTKVYDFIPYQYGCFSYSVYADINAMVQKNILNENKDTVILNDKTDYYRQLRQDDKYYLQQIKSQFGAMSNNDLVRYTYINYPYWATKSTIANKILSPDEYENILKSKPKSDKTVLYTIGYEGISLEEYLNRLIKNDVKVLVDVRRNPLSMKYGFSKSQLLRYCGNAGIEYVHYPEVGIESEQRQELNTQADYDKLFELYKKNNLSQTVTVQNCILSLLKQKERIALTCEELVCTAGFTEDGKLLIKPSRKGQKKLTEKLHEVVFSNKAAAQNKLIVKLNPVLTGWGNYYRHVVSKKIFSKIDHILVQQLRRWAFRRHHNKSRDWCTKRYFKTDGSRHWCFKCQAMESGKKKIFTLKLLSDIPIVRHIKVKKEANPFDPSWDDYFEQRKLKAKLKRSYGKFAGPVQM